MLKRFIFAALIMMALLYPLLAQNPNQPIWTIKTNDDIKHVTFHPNSQFIATGRNDGRVVIYSVNDGSEVKRFDDGFNSDYATIFSPGGKYLAYGGAYGFRIVDFATYEIKQTINESTFCIAINSQETVAATGSNDAISFWNIETGKLIKKLSKIVQPDNHGNTPDVFALQYSPDGTHIAFTMSDGKLRFLNLANDSIDYVYNSGYGVMTYSNDGTMIAFKTGIANYAVQVMNAATKQIVASLPGYPQSIEGINFSIDGKYLLYSNTDLAEMWIYTINPLKLIYHYTGNSFQTISMSLDGKYFVSHVGPYLLLYQVPWNITGIGTLEKNKSKIYPIPSSNMIELEYINNKSSVTKIYINNLEGNFIKEIFNSYLEEGLRKFQISTKDIPNGIYFINVEQAGSKESFKFIIEK